MTGPAKGASIRRPFWRHAATVLAVVLSGQTARAAAPDCPLQHEAYSSRTMLADLLRDPRAKAVLLRDAPAGARLPFGPADASGPTGFSRIITPALLLANAPGHDATLALLDRDLAAIALTPAIMAARCEGYDVTAPVIPAAISRSAGHPALLVFDKITGFRDQASIDAAATALGAMASREGWTIFTTANGAVFNARDLARFDAVVWNNVSGDALTLRQRAAFRRWIEQGGGFVGIHGAGGDPAWFWDWYADTLIGARFIGHPMKPQFQAARVTTDPASPITRGIGDWTMTEEWYSFAATPRKPGVHVLAVLDEASYDPTDFSGKAIRMGDHPIAWTRCVGEGRSFYTAIGHRPESYTEPHAAALLERGIAWTMSKDSPVCGVP